MTDEKKGLAGQMFDSLKGLVNNITGAGTARDKTVGASWAFAQTDPLELENAYRSNWMCRKAVDIPAFDMLREGWAWQAEDDQIEAIEKEEKRLGIVSKIHEAMTLSRLFGGAALIVSDGAQDAAAPLNPKTIRQGGLSFVSVVDRFALASGPVEFDPASPFYLEPKYYSILTLGDQASLPFIHPSRVIRFIGARIPKGHRQIVDEWGDSILESVDIAIKDATSGQAGIAALIAEAKVDVIKVPGLTEKVSTKKYQEALQTRFELANRLKSYINAYIMDKEEDYEQKQINFSQLPDVQRLLLQIVSGAVDIPATRFLSQSPAGLSSTGESDMRNYYDRVKAEQNLFLRPRHDRLNELVIRSALGDFPDDVSLVYNPLWQPTEIEKATIAKQRADEVKVYSDTGLVPEIVLEQSVRNRLIESEEWPGIEAAYDDFEKQGGFEAMEEERRAERELALEGQAATVEETRARAKATAVSDAKPRTMYVHRKVKNAAALINWANAQGIKGVQSADQLHVTIAFSREPVDWFEFREDYEPEIKVKGGARLVERLGPKQDALVLLFKSNALHWRHREFIEGGASWDHDEYQPHVTISWKAGDIDINSIEPYNGEIILGPEIFEDVKENWRSMFDAVPSQG